MGQQASITLNAVVYDPAGSSNGIVKWVNRTGGILNSFSNLTQGFVVNSGARKLTKISYRLEIPVVATEDSTYFQVGAVMRTSSVQIDFWVDPDATAAERADLLARAVGLVGSTPVSDAVSNLDPAYA